MSTAEKLMLPDRLFQPGTETNKLERINRFCGEKHLEDVKTALGNDFSKIKESFMGPFIEFIERKEVIFSRNIVHYLLQRRIMTVDNQLWFAFGEQPMRFGLREFALTTGLKCCEDQPENSSRKRSRESKDAWWMKKPKKLCELVAIMQAGEKADDENLRLGALIICVVIFISSNPATNISIETLKRAKNFKEFCGLPWGKISYQALKDSIMFLNPIKMSKSQYFLCGFNIALQFWAMSSVKQLGLRFGIRGPSRDLPLCFQWIGNVAPSYREVAEVAESDEVEVTCIVGDRDMLQNLEEVGDAEFEKVIKLVQSGYRIKRDDWVRRFIIVGSIETDKTIDDQYIIGVLKSKVKKLTISNMILKKNVTYLKKKLWIKTREEKKVEPAGFNNDDNTGEEDPTFADKDDPGREDFDENLADEEDTVREDLAENLTEETKKGPERDSKWSSEDKKKAPERSSKSGAEEKKKGEESSNKSRDEGKRKMPEKACKARAQVKQKKHDTTEGKKRKQTNKDRDDNIENVSRTSTKKKMKLSGRPFSEDSDVEEVIILSDSEGETSAKEEKRNRNKEEGQCAEEPQHPEEEEPKRGQTNKESQHQEEKESEQEETCKQDEAQKTQEEAQQKQKEEHHPEVEKDAYIQDILSQDEMDKIDEKLKELSDYERSLADTLTILHKHIWPNSDWKEPDYKKMTQTNSVEETKKQQLVED